MKERVTLIIGEDRVEAYREDLASKSRYFASLFSPNFSDSVKNEHRMNYDIDTKHLQAFVDWASDSETSDVDNDHHIKSNLMRFTKDSSEFEDILKMLQLGVLFTVEELLMDLTDLISCQWLNPNNSLQLWMLAKELGLTTLRDLCLAICVEYLDHLPESLIMELPAGDFRDLLGNIHIRICPNRLLSMVERWIKCHPENDSEGSINWDYPFILSKKADLLTHEKLLEFNKQQYDNNVQCVVGHKVIADNQVQAWIYCWDGTMFYELVELRNGCSTNPKQNIVGRQVVGRGFDIYVIGGEYGLGKGRFEKEIWRYSTISKTWYYVTSLPEPRRHMAVIFIGQKLLLIGGVGRHRLKLSSVDVYDIYTGKWSKAADVPEDFTSVPLTFHIDTEDSIALYKSALYVYSLKTNSWKQCSESYCSNLAINPSEDPYERQGWLPLPVQFLMLDGSTVYILCYHEFIPGGHITSCTLSTSKAARYAGSTQTVFDTQVANGPSIIGFSYKNESVIIELLKKPDIGGSVLKSKIVYNEKRSDIQDLCCNTPMSCFNISNPNTLNKKFLFTT